MIFVWAYTARWHLRSLNTKSNIDILSMQLAEIIQLWRKICARKSA